MTFTFKLSKRLAHSRIRTTRFLAAALLLAGCADAIGTEPSEPSTPDTATTSSAVASVTLSPGSASGVVGQSAQFSAVVKDAQGRVLSGRTVTWTSSNTAVVTVTTGGYATAVGGGSATINATVGGVTGKAPVNVTGAVISVGSVAVTPGTAAGNIGDGAQFSAVVTDAAGAVLTGQAVTWSSSNTNVVTVNATGYASAIGGGTADIIATAAGKSGKATVTVAGAPVSTVATIEVSPGTASGNVGDAAQFSAVVKDAAGNAMTGQALTWRSTNTAVVTVTASGYATAVGGGSAAIVATAGGKSGQAAITVAGGTTPPNPPTQPAAVASVTLSPSSFSVGVGAAQTITATLRDASGNVLTGRSISWSSTNPVVGGVNTSGLVTGLVAGTTVVTATSEGKSASASVTVTAVAPPPPPSGGGIWSHEPSGYTLLTDNAFDQMSTSGWDIAWNDRGYASIVSDNSATVSPGSVLQMSFPAGFGGGEGPASEWRPLPNLRRMYVGYNWKASNPWQGHPSNVNKILFMFPSSGGDIYMAMYGPPGGPYELRVLPQFPGYTSEWLLPNVNNTRVTLGTWHKIEWVMDFDAGVIQWWMDGQLIGDHRGLSLPSGGMTEFKINPTWGGLGDTKQTNDYFRYDHIRISGN